MCEGIYLDNDVVLKMCTYLAAAELVRVSSTESNAPAILGLGRFTLRARIQRSRTIVKKDAVREALEAALVDIRQLEPTSEEIQVAANLEERATARGLAFDVGESQLLAMMLSRNAIAFVTGDKRAIKAIAAIAGNEINGRVGCFEQLVASVIIQFGVDRVRQNVCVERECDKAITASFSCSSPTLSLDEAMIGLRSYIKSLRGETDKLLLSSDDLSAIIS